MKTLRYFFVFATLLAACQSKPETSATQPAGTPTATAGGFSDDAAVPVTLANVTREVRAEPIVASGTVSSSEEGRLSFKIGGIIQRIFVQEGQPVRRGQLLATLNLAEINAQVGSAQLAAEKAERDLGRAKALYADTAATLEQLQNATTGQNVARQNLTIARFNQQYAQIRATLNGTVTRKLMNEGEFAQPGAAVLLVSGTGPANWVVRVGVADKDWARLKLGDRATVRMDAYPDRQFTGTVSQLAQAADPMNKLYQVEIRLAPGAATFAPGLFAKVELTPAQRRAYAVVPVEAIVEGNGKEGFVYVLADDRKKVRKLPVQIGFLAGDKVLLTQGLDNVVNVVTAGSAFLTEESNVIVK